MANNPYNSKVQLADGTVLIDLTGDTIAADKLLAGVTAHDKSGAPITGTVSSMTQAQISTAVTAGWNSNS